MLAERYGVVRATSTPSARSAPRSSRRRAAGRVGGGGPHVRSPATRRVGAATGAQDERGARARWWRCGAPLGRLAFRHVSDTEFLHTLTPTESDALEEMGEPGTYPPGAVIFEQGGTADCVLLVRSGRVRIAARHGGRRGVVLAERGAGELLGDLSGIDGQPRSRLGDGARGGARPGRAAARVPRLPDGPPAGGDLAARADLAPPARSRSAARPAEAWAPPRAPSTRACRPPSRASRSSRPVLAAPFHLRGDLDSAPYGYGRDGNPTWTAVEAALGELEDAEGILFSSGMAAMCAIVEPALGAGDTIVVMDDGYPASAGSPPTGSRRGESRSASCRPTPRRRGGVPRRDAGLGRDAVQPRARHLRHRRGRGGRPRRRRPPGGRQHAAHAAGAAAARARRRHRRCTARRRRSPATPT